MKINENQCRYSFDEENIEPLEKIEDYTISIKDLLLKAETSEYNFFESKIQSLDIKEQILLNSIRDIKISRKNDESKFILFETQKNENSEYDKSMSISNEINKIVHKTLHKKKMINGKETKECIFYDDLNRQLTESEDIDKKISNLKYRNGKGKEFNIFDKLIFEGEYLKGERNGKGKEYNYDGKLGFEGQYLNGKRNGQGKEYNYDGKKSDEKKEGESNLEMLENKI